MGTYTLYGAKSGGYRYNDPNTHYSGTTIGTGFNEQMAVSFAQLPTEIKYKKILSITPSVYATLVYPSTSYLTMYSEFLKKETDPDTITYNTAITGGLASTGVPSTSLPGWVTFNYNSDINVIRPALLYGIVFNASAFWSLYSTLSSYSPYVVIAYDDVDITLKLSPSGSNTYLTQARSNTFKWFSFPSSYLSVEQVKQTSAQFQWRVGSSGTIHSISVGASDTNDATDLSVPAGTFPAGEIQWRVIATAKNGTTATMDWQTSTVLAPEIGSPSPTSGYVAKGKDNRFSWRLVQRVSPTSQYPLSVDQASATFQWRTSESAAITSISCGTASSVTIPSGTFTTDRIQWRVTAATAEGASATSDWFTLSTLEAAGTAETVSPKGIVIDSSVDNVFTWRHIISTGTEQTKAELQISSDNSTWTALATVNSSSNSYTVPANTLGTGTKYWRVRTYNTDNVASEWSASAQFVSVGAPDAPVVVIQSTAPRPSISWQATGQQAYQVEIDGVTASGTRFGTDKRYRSPVYLADGNYTVRVRVQNEYGFWSPWGTAALPVTNIPGGAITLTASTENAVTLAWVDSDNYDFYIVYRDGTPIAKAEDPGYVDNMAIGACTYQVRGCYSDNDYYGVSAEVSVSVTPEYNVLYDMDAGEWLTMKYSGLTNQPVTRSISRSIAEVRLSGYTYPVAERSKAKTATYDGNVVFLNRDSAEKFEGMIGHLVCLKLHPSGGCIGYLNEVSGEVNQYKSVYSFMVTQIEYEEEIDIDS